MMEFRFPVRKTGDMESKLADFIERYSETIVESAIGFAKSIDLGKPLDDAELCDHLPEIIAAIAVDLRTPQNRDEEIRKSEGRAPATKGWRAAAASHALNRAQSGYSIAHLVSEYRALRASVLRAWVESPDWDSRSHQDITRFNEAIDEAVAEAVSHYEDEVERWRNIFLAILGHELRSPLSAIVMTAQIIARQAGDAPIATAASRLIRSGEHMRELLDKLLVYNRTQLGMGLDIDKGDVDLAKECMEEIEMLQASMPRSRIHFRSPESLRGMFDSGRVREALANLVANAQKYGAREGEISVDLRAEGRSAVLAVQNVGEDIPPQILPLLFDPLRRSGVCSTESERSSLGLGLFIVDQIAKAHGGTVQAESTNGRTTFKMDLPRGQAPR
jgi:signal transduction histidine kinase